MGQPQNDGFLWLSHVCFGYWENRNLRMVANIREVIGNTLGKRTLSIVGASHKWYFEAYLNMMHDAKVVDSAEVLR